MTKKSVVVKGGSLYYVSDGSSGTFGVYKSKTWSNSHIGEAKTMEDALALIKSHSGRDIEKIG